MQTKATNSPDSVARRRAAAVVLVAVIIPVLVGFAALTIDIGYMFSIRAELQATADSTALAGASGLPEGPDAVRSRIMEYAAKHEGMANVKLENADVVLGHWDAEYGVFSPVDNEWEDRPDAARVTVEMSAERGNAVPLFFSAIFGRKSTNIRASATATFGIADEWDVIIVQDISGSFTDALDSAKEADEALLDCLANHTSNASRLGLITFTGTERLIHALEPIHSGFDAIVQKVRDLNSCCWFFCGSRPRCMSGTNIGAGINLAIDQFLAAPSVEAQVMPAIVLVSDGKPQAGDSGSTDKELQDAAVAAADAAWAQGISIYTVYYAGSSATPVADAEFISKLVRGSGTFSSTPDPDELSTLVWEVCASLPLVLVQ